MHVDLVWMMLCSGLAIITFLICSSILKARKHQRLRKVILRRLQ